MKIEHHSYCDAIDDRESIEKFADNNGLAMVIDEYFGSQEADYRCHYHAHFRSGEIVGIGSTQDEAIADYARKISNHLLIVNATGPDRREIRVPHLVHKVTS